jgi:chromosome segregation ATPase|mmetsp:Transcript_71994/g.114140  ORF Transcript_71994/g.114140 Transcript_71994/m.114140 type:complete len:321 (+) Transcript_71994:46-1008(+)|eukprot:CAMPEP_0169119668 /NCGR_PEP_ID=MMETSP1015-20121227/31687_1 /TAXON_ID=342587 /ORGANISM="Karlodinium micrum, Strain CCMP2283" /LENGTH=320 /DNA_ID=CAMNT_0009182579 /DNA_START=39 /DNA_END=1001 /DNA_ORIENTATION=+
MTRKKSNRPDDGTIGATNREKENSETRNAQPEKESLSDQFLSRATEKECNSFHGGPIQQELDSLREELANAVEHARAAEGDLAGTRIKLEQSRIELDKVTTARDEAASESSRLVAKFVQDLTASRKEVAQLTEDLKVLQKKLDSETTRATKISDELYSARAEAKTLRCAENAMRVELNTEKEHVSSEKEKLATCMRDLEVARAAEVESSTRATVLEKDLGEQISQLKLDVESESTRAAQLSVELESMASAEKTSAEASYEAVGKRREAETRAKQLEKELAEAQLECEKAHAAANAGLRELAAVKSSASYKCFSFVCLPFR